MERAAAAQARKVRELTARLEALEQYTIRQMDKEAYERYRAILEAHLALYHVK